MSRLITLCVNSVALIMILALSLSHNAYAEKDPLANVTANSNNGSSGPAFLNYAQQQTQENNTQKTAAESKRISTGSANDARPQNTKRVIAQPAIIAQKEKTIRQLQKQLAEKTTAVPPPSLQQQELLARVKQLQDKLDAATAEKQQLIQQALTADKTKTQNMAKSAETEKIIAQQAAKISVVESEKQKLETFLSTVVSQEQGLKTQLATSVTEKQDLAEKLTAASIDKQKLMAKVTDAQLITQALTAKLDVLTITQQQASETNSALTQQSEKDKQQLQAKTAEIERLNAALTASNADKKPSAIALTSESQQQAYAIGVSMGDKALKVLSTRDAQGVKIDLDTALRGIVDAFSGTIALDEETRDKALIAASEKVANRLHKIEQQSASDGKRYQEEFAKQKGVILSQGAYSRIDFLGEGKINDDDIVTVTIKEMLTDGTVINDMAAEDKVLAQKLKTYPPIFLAAIRRLENHGTVTIVIPAERAYGAEGRPPKIPPGATMVYSVSIIDAVAAPPQLK